MRGIDPARQVGPRNNIQRLKHYVACVIHDDEYVNFCLTLEGVTNIADLVSPFKNINIYI